MWGLSDVGSGMGLPMWGLACVLTYLMDELASDESLPLTNKCDPFASSSRQEGKVEPVRREVEAK